MIYWWNVDVNNNDDDDNDDGNDGGVDDEESNGMALWQFWLYLGIDKPITLCCHNDRNGNLQ